MKILRILPGFLFLLLALAVLYVLGGTSDVDTLSEYTVTVSDPESGWLDVSLTITPSFRPFVDLYLREPISKSTGEDFKTSGLSEPGIPSPVGSRSQDYLIFTEFGMVFAETHSLFTIGSMPFG